MQQLPTERMERFRKAERKGKETWVVHVLYCLTMLFMFFISYVCMAAEVGVSYGVMLLLQARVRNLD